MADVSMLIKFLGTVCGSKQAIFSFSFSQCLNCSEWPSLFRQSSTLFSSGFVLEGKRVILSTSKLHGNHSKWQRKGIATVIHTLSPLFAVFSLASGWFNAIKFWLDTALWEELISGDVISVIKLRTYTCEISWFWRQMGITGNWQGACRNC